MPLPLRQRLALVSADMADAYAVQGWRATGLDCVLAGFGDAALLYAEPTAEQLHHAQRVLAELGLTELAKRLFTLYV